MFAFKAITGGVAKFGSKAEAAAAKIGSKAESAGHVSAKVGTAAGKEAAGKVVTGEAGAIAAK